MLINPVLRARSPTPARTVRRTVEHAGEKRPEPRVAAQEHDLAGRTAKAAAPAKPAGQGSTDLLA